MSTVVATLSAELSMVDFETTALLNTFMAACIRRDAKGMNDARMSVESATHRRMDILQKIVDTQLREMGA